jgi:hypothetical protein
MEIFINFELRKTVVTVNLYSELLSLILSSDMGINIGLQNRNTYGNIVTITEFSWNPCEFESNFEASE